MKTIIIKFTDSEYQDIEAIKNVISYIHRGAHYIGGYYFWPVNEQVAIQQFFYLYEMNPTSFGRRIWHFFISFPSSVDKFRILSMADYISGSVFQNYPIFYGLHYKRRYGQFRYHLHMAVLPVGYNSEIPELTPDTMQSYINTISECLKQMLQMEVSIIINRIYT